MTTPLASYLDRKKMTYKEFAALCGVSPSYLCRIATGERVPRIDVMRKIEKATKGDVSMKDMLA